MYGTVYKITHKASGKVYIGQTTSTPRKRFLNHSDKKYDTHLARAIRKYGRESFEIEVVAVAKSKKSLNLLERRFIKQFKSSNPLFGYNLTLGGHGPHTPTEECNLKNSRSKKRHRFSGFKPLMRSLTFQASWVLGYTLMSSSFYRKTYSSYRLVYSSNNIKLLNYLRKILKTNYRCHVNKSPTTPNTSRYKLSLSAHTAEDAGCVFLEEGSRLRKIVVVGLTGKNLRYYLKGALDARGGINPDKIISLHAPTSACAGDLQAYFNLLGINSKVLRKSVLTFPVKENLKIYKALYEKTKPCIIRGFERKLTNVLRGED